MPDPLDPTDAFYAAFAGPFVRLGSFAAISFGGHAMGSSVQALSHGLSSFGTSGWSGVTAAVQFPSWEMFLQWLSALIAAFHIPLAWPFLGILVWQFVRLKGDDELFSILIWTALAQAGLSFLAAQHAVPLAGASLGIGLTLLLLAMGTVTGLSLWWRQISEAASAREVEPEL